MIADELHAESSTITKSSSYVLQQAITLLLKNKNKATSLNNLKEEGCFNTNQMHMVRREFNKIDGAAGKIRYLSPVDRLVILVDRPGVPPEVTMAAEAACYQLQVPEDVRETMINEVIDVLLRTHALIEDTNNKL